MMRELIDSDVICLESVDSTNEEIKRTIQGFAKPTWIIAKKQTKGKGRNGKSWLSSAGNFSGSIVFFPAVERSIFHLYGFFFGVALYNTVKKIVKKGVDVRLKWPNDLMIENDKVSGILLEIFQFPNNIRPGLIVGVGVNLNSSPNLNASHNNRYNTQCVANFTNFKIDPKKFFCKFNDELIRLGSYVDENNLFSILDFWKRRSYDKGSIIQISDNRGGFNSGKFLGLDEIGGLIVSDNSGTKKIYSGDVYFGG